MSPRIAMKKAVDWFGSHAWPERHFERIYSRAIDPWRCASSDYERLKLERTAHAVARLASADRVLDAGCGEGMLAEALGARGYSISAIDVSPSAIRRARERCASYTNVQFITGNILADAVRGRYDVIVLSEVLYYLGVGPRRRAMCARMVAALADGGHIVVTGPWPAARTIEYPLRHHRSVDLIDEQIYQDPGRPYAISTYRHNAAAP